LLALRAANATYGLHRVLRGESLRMRRQTRHIPMHRWTFLLGYSVVKAARSTHQSRTSDCGFLRPPAVVAAASTSR
jgi:hypothetical protein